MRYASVAGKILCRIFGVAQRSSLTLQRGLGEARWCAVSSRCEQRTQARCHDPRRHPHRLRQLDKTVRLWDAVTGKPVGDPLTGHTGAVDGVAFSPDGTRIVSGKRDPRTLAGLARASARKKTDRLEEALRGFFTDHHATILQMMLDNSDRMSAQIAALDRGVEEAIGPFSPTGGPAR